MKGNRERGVGGRRHGNCWNWLMYLFIQKASPSYYLWDSSPGSQCPCSLSSFKPLSELSPPPFNLKLVFKYTTTKKIQQPCKTVTDNVHNKHNASTLELHVYRTSLNIGGRIVLLTFTQYLVTPLGCWMLHWCMQFLSIIADIYLIHILKSRFHSLRSQDGIFPQDLTIYPRKLLA